MLKQVLIGGAMVSSLALGITVLHAQEDSTLAPPTDGVEDVDKDAFSPEAGLPDEEVDGMSAQAPAEGEFPEMEVSDDMEGATEETAEAPVVDEGVTAEEESLSAEAISDEDIQGIAETLGTLDDIAADARTKVEEVITDAGLSEERYVEIYQTINSPDTQVDANISPEEAAQFQQANIEVAAVEQDTIQQQEQVILDAGYEPAEFNQIVALIRQDPDLSQQLEQVQ